MPTNLRQEKVSEQIRHIASNYLARESNRTSLITVTSVDISPDFAHSTIFVSIYPENKEEEGLKFLKRERSNFRTYAKRQLALRTIPLFDFEIDMGEKNRQHIEKLSEEVEK